MSQENKNKPIKSFRAANIEASVFRNKVEKKGEIVIRHSVKIQKHFQNDEGVYEKTNNYFPNELSKLILVAQKAFEFISLKESADTADDIPV